MNKKTKKNLNVLWETLQLFWLDSAIISLSFFSIITLLLYIDIFTKICKFTARLPDVLIWIIRIIIWIALVCFIIGTWFIIKNLINDKRSYLFKKFTWALFSACLIFLFVGNYSWDAISKIVAILLVYSISLIIIWLLFKSKTESKDYKN